MTNTPNSRFSALGFHHDRSNLYQQVATQVLVAVVTGKPLAFGGSEGRERAIGQGLVFVVEVLLPKMGVELDKMTYIVVGYGNVSSWTARVLIERGSTLKAVIDHAGAIFNDKGIGMLLPTPQSLDLSGMNMPEQDLAELLKVDASRWIQQISAFREHYARFGDKLTKRLADQFDQIEQRLKATKQFCLHPAPGHPLTLKGNRCEYRNPGDQTHHATDRLDAAAGLPKLPTPAAGPPATRRRLGAALA